MQCYRGGGCGPYEMYPCNECPASRPTYLERKKGSPKEDTKMKNPIFGTASVKLHLNICSELNELYARKNADYGDSFHQTFLEEGWAMPRIRLSDKLSRFKTLSRSAEQQVKDESLRDTLIDLANYAIMSVMELDRMNNREGDENDG